MSFYQPVKCRAPTRIDLAGGTLDLWPLYLFLEDPTTLNLAISLFAETEIHIIDSRASNPEITLKALDQGKSFSFKVAEVDSVSAVDPALQLHFKYVKYALQNWRSEASGPLPSFCLETEAKSPAGAGLGGSSTLSVSIIGALRKFFTGTLDVQQTGEALIDLTRDVETTVIKVPAGLQDYYAAMFGGLQSLQWKIARHQKKSLSDTNRTLLGALQNRVTLFFSGKSRNSGINNWVLFKELIDQNPQVQKSFQDIAAITGALTHALLHDDFTNAARLISLEWEERKKLAPTISTPEIDRAFWLAAELGIPSGKICGAGGGGCFFFFQENEDAEKKSQLIQAVTQNSEIIHLPFSVSPLGLTLLSADTRAP